MEYIIYELLNTTENKVLIEFAKLFNVTPAQIIEQNKNRHLSDIRHLYCKLRHEMHGANYSTIAREINRTHTTVRYGIMRVNDLIYVNEKKIVHNPPYRDVANKAIPIYDINAAANLKTLFASDSTQHVLGEVKIPNAPDCDGAIYVRGDSMYPLVKSGDIVSYKQLQNIENLIAGEMYVVDFEIDGDDFLVIKYVKWEERNATLRLVSYNEHHQDMIIPASAVRAIALVKIVIRINSMV
jgi:hypothetical protein